MGCFTIYGVPSTGVLTSTSCLDYFGSDLHLLFCCMLAELEKTVFEGITSYSNK